jgi:hypothetical protein
VTNKRVINLKEFVWMKKFAPPPRSRVAGAEHYGPSIVDDVSTRQAAEAPFSIHLANTDAGRHSVCMLINKMYRWRGYGDRHQLTASPGRITLAASGLGRVLGTVTLGTDASDGMLADEIFKDEIDCYRKAGATVCEVTKLAIDPLAHPKLALAALFHILYLYARKIHRCTDAFIEVNPRHRRFYEQMLGFQQAATVRHNPRVNAKAHLLRISLEQMGVQIARLGGTAGDTDRHRSLYPYFFGRLEEVGITKRLFAL